MNLLGISLKILIIAAIHSTGSSAWRRFYETPDDVQSEEFLSNLSPVGYYNPYDLAENRDEEILMKKRGPISDSNEEDLSAEETKDIFSDRKKKEVEKKQISSPSAYENNDYYVGSLAANKKKRNAGLLDNYLKSALESDKVTIKKKRSTDDVLMNMEVNSEPSSQTFDENGIDKINELMNIERMSLLEAENAYLKEALDAATRAQVLGNDRSDLNKEIETLSAAEQVSEMISDLDRDEKLVQGLETIPNIEEDDIEDNAEERKRRRKRFEERKRHLLGKRQNEMEQCAPVEELMNGCSSLSFKFGLILDNEAKLACDTHKLCYACGGPTAYDECDTLYQAEVSTMCTKEDDPERCLEQAVAFLDVMQEEHDSEDNQLSEQTCQLPCVKAFL